MKRIVYSPKVYVFVKADTGIYDLTPYIVDCSVTRKINEVSSASVTFRNPNKMFTNSKDGPTFHPMDPIVIFMKRLDNKPVQVFTGYCDSTPYFQLKPTTATITASCTLKRLLYTYWDPGLPFVQEVLAQRGWSMEGREGGLSIANTDPNDQSQTDEAGDGGDSGEQTANAREVPEVSDGSIGALLYDILLYIGNWDPETIYIEPIPAGLYWSAESLIAESNEANKEARKQFNELLKYIIGEGGYGNSVPGTGGNVSGEGAAIQIMQILTDNQYDLNAAAGITGNAWAESSWDPSAIEPGTDNGGLWGFTSSPVSLAELRAFAESKGKPWTDVNVQTEFMMNNINHPGPGFKQKMNNTNSVEEAAELFMTDWEKPGVPRLEERIWGAKKAKQLHLENNVPNSSGAGQPGANTG